ncbi:hypothetical protein AYL99_06558 [Fonsecaea erecta]|uniref:FAD-binding domain-containing protein n=1 Tax=Fonsecaea erecta TaxID=1367422 RepID=A0A178ZHJ9_9EURO|nr:hypothetical protein AYL99_06558 [Fonsecaea erecta]OAP59260.1 hypothetical protein AYL99_06558 [Fonsecaea erecta]
MAKPVALIVGAGIAGLAAAWWLDKAGWQSIVVDRAEAFRVGGYTMTISGLGHETVKHMDLLDELQSVSQHFEYNIINDCYGRELCRVKYVDVHGGGLDALAVRRDELARLLAKSLPDSCSIRFQETVREFTDEGDKVRVVLAGGDVIEADLMIGADGFRSQIRQSLWKDTEGDFLEPLGYYYAAYNFSQEAETQNDCHSFNRPGQLDMLFALRGKGMTAMHIWREDQTLSTESPQDKFNILHRITADSVQQVRDAVDRADEAGALVNMDSLTLVKLPRWSQGRVLLLGDAAHCLTLLSGQGAGMALVSAEILGKELQKTSDVLEALRNHEAKLRPSIERLQARSRRMAAWFIPKSTLAYYFRNLVLRLLPYSWIVDFHASSLKSEIELT